MPRHVMASVIALMSLTATGGEAQWLNYPTPGIPRLPDGKPNLNAPAPRTADGKPDLSGLWSAACGQGCPVERRELFDLANSLSPEAVQMTPWAAAIQKQRESRRSVDDPAGYCLPSGVPRINFNPAGFKIVQTPNLVVLLYETTVMLTFRQVFTDGRPLPTDPQPTWLGYSVGRWDGDTFVVESTGFRDRGWLDTQKGRPHSDALRVTERIRRLDFGHLELTTTIDDPKAYVNSWTITTAFLLRADSELLEAFCEGQDKTMEHRRIDPATPEPPSPPLSSDNR